MSMRLCTAHRAAVRPSGPARVAVPRITAFLNDGQEQPQKVPRISTRRQQLRAKQESRPKSATAWNLFVNDHRASVKKELMEASQPANTAAVMKKCSELWAAAGEEVKAPYKEAAEWRKLEIAEWNEKHANSAKAAVLDTVRDKEEEGALAAPSVDTIEQDSVPELVTRTELREDPQASSYLSAREEAGPSDATEPGHLARPPAAAVEELPAVARMEPDNRYNHTNGLPIPEVAVAMEGSSSTAAAPPQPAFSSWHKGYESPGTGPEY